MRVGSSQGGQLVRVGSSQGGHTRESGFKSGRKRGRVVRALDLKAGGPGFKSRSDH